MEVEDEIKETLKPFVELKNEKKEPESSKKNYSLFANMKQKFSTFSMVSKMQYSSEATKNALQIPKLGDDKTYNSNALAHFWLIFKIVFKKNEEIAKVY